MIFLFDGGVIEHGPQRRRPGRKLLSLVKRLGAHLADMVYTHQASRMRALGWRKLDGLRGWPLRNR
jgi:hypothetical protein